MQRKFLILFLLPVVFLTGCRKGFVGINTDPNLITAQQINFNYLFTNAQLQTAGNTDGNGFEDWRNNLIYSGCIVQHLSSTLPYWDGDKYLYNATYNSAYWDKNYPNSIANITAVIEQAKTDSSQFNLHQIARIFRVFMFQRMTDMYGDCPYSEAGKGYISGITSPSYDRQENIYADMFNELQDAASLLDPSRPNTIGQADLLYGGAISAWKKFAYSEMVRLAMRLSKVDPANAQKWVNIAVQGGVMNSYTDNAVLQHQNVTGTPVVNGTGLILVGNDPDGYRLSQTLVDFLRQSADPRLPYLATVCSNPSLPSDKGDTIAAHQVGQPNGYDPPNSETPYDLINAPGWPDIPQVGTPDSSDVYQNRYSVVNRYTFARLDAPTFFLTCGETLLLLAEAAQRGWISGDPSVYYSQGVEAAMQQLTQAGAGPSGSVITTWLSWHPYDGTLQQINTQYWVAGFMDENECFANWRRSGYPLLKAVNYPGNVTGGTIPRRFTYPQDEASTNTSNYNSAVSRLSGGDKMTSRVWWDK